MSCGCRIRFSGNRWTTCQAPSPCKYHVCVSCGAPATSFWKDASDVDRGPYCGPCRDRMEALHQAVWDAYDAQIAAQEEELLEELEELDRVQALRSIKPRNPRFRNLCFDDLDGKAPKTPVSKRFASIRRDVK